MISLIVVKSSLNLELLETYKLSTLLNASYCISSELLLMLLSFTATCWWKWQKLFRTEAHSSIWTIWIFPFPETPASTVYYIIMKSENVLQTLSLGVRELMRCRLICDSQIEVDVIFRTAKVNSLFELFSIYLCFGFCLILNLIINPIIFHNGS